LNRDLTDADHLYFNSLAIAGTHTSAGVELIQRPGASLSSLAELIQQWDDYVTNRKRCSQDPPWTNLVLYQAMEEKISGEGWQSPCSATATAQERRLRRAREDPRGA
jgi:hypothetical protein